ncbi:hypothetical protein J3R83DRAFT_10674 [Lanmaoa asiatica]|nr:hypothetical protein J3R83DRAFT_10674 [Lanmaoa asiatica]
MNVQLSLRKLSQSKDIIYEFATTLVHLGDQPFGLASGCHRRVIIRLLCPKEPPQLKSTEDKLVQFISDLTARNHTFNTLLTPEEVEIHKMETLNFSTGGKVEEEVLDAVHREMAMARGEVIEIDSDKDNLELCITGI